MAKRPLSEKPVAPASKAPAVTPKPRPKRKRAPGRPLGEATADLRQGLQQAALICFARNGVGVTSLRDIATEAGVTPALLHYYYGDKAQLLEAVIQERLLPLFAVMHEPLARAGDDIAALIVAYVDGIGRIVAEHPWLPSLWVREVLCEGGALRDLLFERIGPQVPQMMAQRFSKAQAQGRINPDLDPRLLMVSLVGLTLFPVAGAPIWRRLFDTELSYEALRHHTLALLDRGLELDHAQ